MQYLSNSRTKFLCRMLCNDVIKVVLKIYVDESRVECPAIQLLVRVELWEGDYTLGTLFKLTNSKFRTIVGNNYVFHSEIW